MQEVGLYSLYTDSRALRAEYSIVGIPHKLARKRVTLPLAYLAQVLRHEKPSSPDHSKQLIHKLSIINSHKHTLN